MSTEVTTVGNNKVMVVGDLIDILKEHSSDTTLDTVFKDRLDFLCSIIRAIDPKKLAYFRSRTARAQRAVNEVKTLAFRASLVPLLAEWKKEPAKFFEPWSLQPDDAESKPDRIEPGDVESEPSGIESEQDDIESEAESTESEPESAGSGLRDTEPDFENVATTKRSDLKVKFYQKIHDTRKVLCRKQADAIRWIFFSLFFRDLLMAFIGKKKPDTGPGFPRGKALGPLIEKVCIRVTGEPPSATTAKDIDTWAKFGQLYHLIGAELGESAWFLLVDYISQDKWIGELPKRASGLASVLGPIEKLVPKKEVKKYDANKVAKGIRDFQLEPYLQSKLPMPAKRHLSTYNSESACSKRRRMLEQTSNQRPFPEAHLENQAAQEQAGSTSHPGPMETNSNIISGEI